MLDFKINEETVSELHTLIEALVKIPAPSHHEEKRAEFCKRWLTEAGAEGVYIDEALNCVYPIGCEGRDDIVVFMAHTDTVFPDTEPFELKRDAEKLYAPGVGDDTTSLAIMMLVTKAIIRSGLKPRRGVLIVANSCEEGLGNLKGSKKIMEDYKGRIKEFYTFDGKYTSAVNRCVGSHRYEVECFTEGGHSFGAFGNSNAIAKLSELITELYSIEVPKKEGTKTTYNVGKIEGGTSVNTIAQYAKMLYEYRSDDAECLSVMEERFKAAVDAANAKGKGEFKVNIVGIRPCGGEVDRELHARMTENVVRICEKHTGLPCKTHSGSTDCNAAMSVGVPAVCVGIYQGGGAHTREEFVEIKSLPIGMRICCELMLEGFKK